MQTVNLGNAHIARCLFKPTQPFYALTLYALKPDYDICENSIHQTQFFEFNTRFLFGSFIKNTEQAGVQTRRIIIENKFLQHNFQLSNAALAGIRKTIVEFIEVT